MRKRIRENQPLTTTQKKKKKKKKQNIDHHPWLLCKTAGDEGKRHFICCNASVSSSISFPDDFHEWKVLNCCCGWLIFLSNSKTHELSLWNPVLSKSIKLSPLDLKEEGQYIEKAVLSSPGNRTDHLNSNCMITVFVQNYDYAEETSIFYCLVGEKRWNSVCCDDKIIIPNSFIPIPNLVVLNDLVLFDGSTTNNNTANKLFCINRVNQTSVVVSEYCNLPRSSFYGDQREYLVVSRGELFFICIAWTMAGHFRRLEERPSDLKAFKFDQLRMRWHKVSDPGCRLFFQNARILSCDSRRDDKGGFLYYINTDHNSLYSYRFAEKSLSTSSLRSTWINLPTTSLDTYVIYFPDARLIDELDFQINLVVETGKEINIIEETDNHRQEEERENLLFCLPHDLIQFISKFLDPVSYLNFRSLSKICRRLAPPIEWRDAPISSGPLSPWLISYDNCSGIYTLTDSQLSDKYLMSAPKVLVNTKIIDSNHGWLLLTSGTFRTLCLYNPFTTEIVKLPELYTPLRSSRLSNISFSSSTHASSNCKVVALVTHNCEIGIFIHEVGKEIWDEYFFDYSISDVFDFGSVYHPVFHDGDIYVLANTGDLGVVKFQADEPISWEVVAIAKDCDNTLFNHNSLLECDGKLMAVSLIEVGKSINVFSLNKTKMSWEKVNDLGDHSLYLSRFGSLCTVGRENWMKNSIFFSRVIGEDSSIVYYSMNTRKFHAHGGNKSGREVVEYGDSRELIFSSWIQSSWS